MIDRAWDFPAIRNGGSELPLLSEEVIAPLPDRGPIRKGLADCCPAAGQSEAIDTLISEAIAIATA